MLPSSSIRGSSSNLLRPAPLPHILSLVFVPGQPSKWYPLLIPAVNIAEVTFLSSFYQDESGKNWLKDHGFMLEWAQTASRLVLREVDELHEEDVITFLNLALFWHTQGLWRKCFMYKGAALSTIHSVTSWLIMSQELLTRY